MRKLLPQMWVAFACGFLCLSASQGAGPAAGEAYVGTWSGTWEGAGASGPFEVKLETAGGALGGGVNVGTDAGPYTAKFKKVTFDGNKMTARYDYPLDTQAEIALTATFESKSATGTWAIVPQGQEQVLLNGTWTVEKK
jgi:hypothetical protein